MKKQHVFPGMSISRNALMIHGILYVVGKPSIWADFAIS